MNVPARTTGSGSQRLALQGVRAVAPGRVYSCVLMAGTVAVAGARVDYLRGKQAGGADRS
jgi:hypothetical protein